MDGRVNQYWEDGQEPYSYLPQEWIDYLNHQTQLKPKWLEEPKKKWYQFWK